MPLLPFLLALAAKRIPMNRIKTNPQCILGFSIRKVQLRGEKNWEPQLKVVQQLFCFFFLSPRFHFFSKAEVSLFRLKNEVICEWASCGSAHISSRCFWRLRSPLLRRLSHVFSQRQRKKTKYNNNGEKKWNQSLAPLVLLRRRKKKKKKKTRSLLPPTRQGVVPGCGETEMTGRCEHFSDSALRPCAALVARKTKTRHVHGNGGTKAIRSLLPMIGEPSTWSVSPEQFLRRRFAWSVFCERAC